MTNEKAKKIIMNIRNFVNGDSYEKYELKSEAIGALDIAIKVLEKQIPKKPEKYVGMFANYYTCPDCGSVVNLLCGCSKNNCRRAIDWSEEV